jgi:trigger factor
VRRRRADARQHIDLLLFCEDFMQVTVENVGALGRRMTVAVPAARFEQVYSDRLRQMSRQARIPGFRPGKAPIKVVEAQMGGRVTQEVVGDLLRASFGEAVSEKGLKPAGGPSFEPKNLTRGQDLEYVVTFEVYPEVKRLDIQGKKIERAQTSVGESDVDTTLETLRKQRMGWQAAARAAKEGDRLTIDFVGKLNGEAFQGGTATGFHLVLGSHSLIAGFEEGLLGAKAGESRSLSLSFPADYHNKTLAGQPTVFEVTVTEVAEPKLPDVNEEFARQFGIADGSVEKLRAEVRSNLERELAVRQRADLREQVFKAIIEVNALDVPKALEEAEVERLVNQSRQSLAAQGLSVDRIPIDPTVFGDRARRHVALGLILADLIQKRAFKPEQEKVRARLAEMAASYDSPEEFINWHFARPERLAEIESLVLEDMAVDALMETAEVVDKAVVFQDFMRPGARSA